MLLRQLISSLSKEFSMTDLGDLNYFMGISITRSKIGMFLSQKKYAYKLLQCSYMTDVNLGCTPVDSSTKLGDCCTPVADPLVYRSLVEGSHYLTFTRLDISFVFQQICLYMNEPREPHFNALIHILR